METRNDQKKCVTSESLVDVDYDIRYIDTKKN